MNRQLKLNKDGTVKSRGIEWCTYTSNPVRGCFHACQWIMPDGSVANCYAEDAANKFTSAYPEGFEHHYWVEKELKEWSKLKAGERVFVGSMADLFGHWVPEEQVRKILDTMREFPEVAFQTLTKNPNHMMRYIPEFPPNLWAGVSTPPDSMWNHIMSGRARDTMFRKTLRALELVKKHGSIAWLSAEPYTFDAVRYLREYDDPPLDWIVVGAASNGSTYYPPDESLVRTLIAYCKNEEVPVFFKGNLRSLTWAKDNWMEEFPS